MRAHRRSWWMCGLLALLSMGIVALEGWLVAVVVLPAVTLAGLLSGILGMPDGSVSVRLNGLPALLLVLGPAVVAVCMAAVVVFFVRAWRERLHAH